MTLQETLNFVQVTLQAAIDDVSVTEKADVEQPAEISNYNLKHPFAAYLVLLNSDKFSESKSDGAVTQKRDILVSVVSVTRAVTGRMKPAEHCDRIIDALSGIRIASPRGDAYISAEGTKFLQEDEGIWYYEVLIKVPEFYVEAQYRD